MPHSLKPSPPKQEAGMCAAHATAMEEAASATGEKLEAAAGEMASVLEKASEEVCHTHTHTHTHILCVCVWFVPSYHRPLCLSL